MTGTVSTAPVAADTEWAPLGRITVVAGLLGAVSAVVIISWPDQVSDQHYSYPFDATSYTVAQSWFAVQHLGLLAGLYGLTHLAWSRSSRLTRAGLTLCLVGMVGLTACELFAISAADALVDTSRANAVDNPYGFPMVAIGLGLVVAGHRARAATGPARSGALAGARHGRLRVRGDVPGRLRSSGRGPARDRCLDADVRGARDGSRPRRPG